MKKRTARISREAFSSLAHPTSTRHSPFVTIRKFTKKNKAEKALFFITISKKAVSYTHLTLPTIYSV